MADKSRAEPIESNANTLTVKFIPGDSEEPRYEHPGEQWNSDRLNALSALGPDEPARARPPVPSTRGKGPLFTPTLESGRLYHEPLTLDTFQELRARTLRQPHLFKYLDVDASSTEAFDTWLINAVKATDSGERLHFVIREKRLDAVIGHTCIFNLKSSFRVDVGMTWLLTEHQHRGYAIESKRALYDLLFRKHSFRRVTLTADSLNVASIRSILASGAKQENTMDDTRLRRDGTVGHTAVFRILAAEYLEPECTSPAA